MDARGKRTLEILNNLVADCLEAEQSYKKAAKEINDENLKQIFTIQSFQKAEYAAKLRAEIKRLGGAVSPKYDMSSFDSFDNEPQDLIDQCETTEKKVVRNYQLAINDEDVLWEVIPIVSRQYLESQESYNQIKYLKSNYSEQFIHF